MKEDTVAERMSPAGRATTKMFIQAIVTALLVMLLMVLFTQVFKFKIV